VVEVEVVVVERALSTWEALVEACAELFAEDFFPVPAAAAKSHYRVLAACARGLSGFAALLNPDADCVLASIA
jgi:hypothetical protein